jgi:hypothetical protein
VTKLAFSVRAVESDRTLEVYVNGALATSTAIDAEWRRIELDIANLVGDLPFLVELRLAGSMEGLGFDARCFDVRDRNLA